VRARLGIVGTVVAAAGLLAAGVAVGQDEPGQLWKEFPLVPTESVPVLPAPELPASGVAGVQAGGPRPGPPATDLVTPIGPADPLGAVQLGVLLGVLVAAIVLLGAAALPRAPVRGPALLGFVAERRLELTLAGAVLLLATTLVYVAMAS
jgi:hypothetical protein